jgi:hypothetical protein
MDRNSLDRYITGNWGEDSVSNIASIDCPKCGGNVDYDAEDDGEDPIICPTCNVAFGTVDEDGAVKAELYDDDTNGELLMDKQKTAEATVRPWELQSEADSSTNPPSFQIIAVVDGGRICDIANVGRFGNPLARANAALICRAVNNYDGLVAACEAALVEFEATHAVLKLDPRNRGMSEPVVIGMLRLALAAARAE